MIFLIFHITVGERPRTRVRTVLQSSKSPRGASEDATILAVGRGVAPLDDRHADAERHDARPLQHADETPPGKPGAIRDLLRKIADRR